MTKRMFLRDGIKAALESDGFAVVEGFGCFDLLARKGDIRFAIKALMNIDSLTGQEAEDLKTLSCFIDASPLLIGERANRYDLEDSVVYSRFGIPIMSFPCFGSYLSGEKPVVSTRRGGFVVSIDGEKLHECMADSGLSLAALSAAARISRKTASKCAGGGTVSCGSCSSVETVTGEPLAMSVEVAREPSFSVHAGGSVLKRELSISLDRLDLDASFLSRSPFNLLLRKDETFASLVSHSRQRMLKSVDALHGLESGFDVQGVFITMYSSERSIEGMPVIRLGELGKMRSSEDFAAMVGERRA